MKCVLSFFCFGLPGVFEFVVREEVPNGKPIWICKVCNFQAQRKNHTVEHFLYKHAPDENLPCDYCGKIFNKRPTLRKHLIKCKRKYAEERTGLTGVPNPLMVSAPPNVTIHPRMTPNPLLQGAQVSLPTQPLPNPDLTITHVPNPLLQ